MTANPTSNPLPPTEDESPVQPENKQPNHIPGNWRELWNRLLLLGLGETTLHILTGIGSVVLVLVVVWVMGKYFLKSTPTSAISLTGTPTLPSTLLPIASTDTSTNKVAALTSSFGITRLAQLDTNLPNHPRDQIVSYTVKSGDSIFVIANNFGLQPESILWSNRALGENPDNLIPGISILIPPADGAIYTWNNGDGLNGVAKFYGVTPQSIVDWAGNGLDPNKIGDWALPNIPAGTQLFIPNGNGGSVDWLPHITRDNPAVATSLGPGFCGTITEGAIGTGAPYFWPTTLKYLSGYDYTSIHHGIDIAGVLDNPVYAVDDGVVVYAGWNNNGYGNLLIIDHGDGWQSVYGHLDRILVGCGDSVMRAAEVALLGSTGNSSGPHLHFELRYDGSTVNPWDFLQQ